jgi:hypothetical protein
MGDSGARAALCEAAASLILRVQRYCALKAWALKIAKRSTGNYIADVGTFRARAREG